MTVQIIDVAHSLDHAEYPDLETLRSEYGWSDRNHRIFDRMFGLRSAALHRGMALRETLSLSARELAVRNPELVGNVDYLFYCHAVNTTLPVGREELTRLAEEVFGSTPEVMSVAHGACASAIMVIHMLRSFRVRQPSNVVILTGEKCFFELMDYADNQGIYGEATAGVFLKLGSETGTRVTATSVGRFEGVFAPMAKASKEEMAAFDQAFIPKILRLVENSLKEAALHPSEVDLILPTHLSPFTSNRVADRLNMHNAVVWKANLHRIGHCYCGDLFINLRSWLQEAVSLTRPMNILSFASGMTGSHAAIILRREHIL